MTLHHLMMLFIFPLHSCRGRVQCRIHLSTCGSDLRQFILDLELAKLPLMIQSWGQILLKYSITVQILPSLQMQIQVLNFRSVLNCIGNTSHTLSGITHTSTYTQPCTCTHTCTCTSHTCAHMQVRLTIIRHMRTISANLWDSQVSSLLQHI